MSKKISVKRLKLKGSEGEQLIENLDRNGLLFVYARTGKGKTLLGDLIAYGLGWKKKPTVREVQKFDDLYLEFSVDGEDYVIFRKLKQHTAAIHMDKTNLENFRADKNNKYGLNRSKDPATDFSPHILDLLEIPIFTSIPDNVTKSTKASLISFRDILQYVYLWQERIDSDKPFGLADHWALSKAIEAFKVIFNINPSEVYALDSERLKVSQKKDFLEEKIESVREFLRSSGINALADIDREITSQKKELESLQREILEIEEEQTFGEGEVKSDVNYSRLVNLRKDLNSKQEEKLDLYNMLDNWDKLVNSYKRERKNLFLIKKSDDLLEEYEIEQCPCCTNKLSEVGPNQCPLCKAEVEISEEEIDSELQKKLYELDLKERELFEAIQDIKNRISILETEIASIEIDVNQIVKEISKKEEYLRPLFDKYKGLCTHAGNIEADIKNKLYSKSLFSRLEEMHNEAQNLGKIESELKTSLKEIVEKSDKRDKLVRETLLANFEKIVSKLEIPKENKANLDLDKKYLPLIDKESYLTLSSGGFKVYFMTAYFISIIKTIISISDNHHPGLLVIDSIHKNISTTHPEDKKSVEMLFRELANISSKSKNMQVIVIDNELPDFVKTEYRDHVLDISDGLIK